MRSLIGQPANASNFCPLKDNLEYRDLVWEYEDDTELSFSSEDNFILGTISTESKDARLFGKAIVGRPISEVLHQIPDFKLDDDFGENGQDYKIETLDVSIWVIDAYC